jgi:hypothetical protein
LYWCFKLVNADTKSQCISNTVEFRHKYLAIPTPTSEDRIIQGLQQVAGALTRAPPPTSISQVDAIANLWDIFESWRLLAPRISSHPQARPRDFQGCTATLSQEVWCLCLLHLPPHALLLQPGHPNRHLLPPEASATRPPRLGRQYRSGWTLQTLGLSQFQGCRWSAHRLTATRCPFLLYCSPFVNQFPIAHVPVPKHHLRSSPLCGLITNRSSTTSLQQKPPAQLRCHWPLRVSAKLIR